MNYQSGRQLAEVGTRIYCATSNGLFYYDYSDNSIRGLSKIQGYSNIDISAIGYSQEHKQLLIGYEDGVIDVQKNNSITRFEAIALSNISGRKNANNFTFSGNFAFISSAFGIVKYDMVKREVRESYLDLPGSSGSTVEVFDVALFEDTLFAATSEGIIKGALSRNLLDPSSWELVLTGRATTVTPFNNVLYASVAGELKVYNNSLWSNYTQPVPNAKNMVVSHNRLVIAYESGVKIIDEQGAVTDHSAVGPNYGLLNAEGRLFIADPLYALISIGSQGQLDFYRPNGPVPTSFWDMATEGKNVWIAGGGVSRIWANRYLNQGFAGLINGSWQNYNSTNTPQLSGVRDILSVVVDPVTNIKYFGTFGYGMFGFKDGQVVEYYDESNSELDIMPSLGVVRVAGMAFDESGNLWIANYGSDRQVVVKQRNGDWKSFSAGAGKSVADMVIDEYGRKWFVHTDGGVLAFDDETNTSFMYSTGERQGNLPNSTVNAIAIDLDWEIWVGTEEGPAVIHDPSAVFRGANGDAQQIFIRQGNTGSYLLEGEAITAIAVDGGNRKWLGTRRGVWLVSADGTEILRNFTTANSPMVSDVIISIGVNNETGEVFFGTEKGIMSYRGDAVAGGLTHGDVYVYPNPVREDYKGPISITGLVRDANVKITDVSGSLVYESKAAGGLATWNGKNFKGRSVASGVYLVYSSNSDGTETFITKLLIIR